MDNVSKFFLEKMEEERFQKVVSDDFSFVDSLIDESDLNKINNTEDN